MIEPSFFANKYGTLWRAVWSFHLFVEILFKSGKCTAADYMLDFAGVVCRGFLVHSERNKKFAEHGMALAAVAKNTYRTAYTRFGVAHLLTYVDRPNKSFSLTENIYGFKIHLA